MQTCVVGRWSLARRWLSWRTFSCKREYDFQRAPTGFIGGGHGENRQDAVANQLEDIAAILINREMATSA